MLDFAGIALVALFFCVGAVWAIDAGTTRVRVLPTVGAVAVEGLLVWALFAAHYV